MLSETAIATLRTLITKTYLLKHLLQHVAAVYGVIRMKSHYMQAWASNECDKKFF